MNTLISARDTVKHHFANIQEIDEQVIRGEKRYKDKCYAVVYVDLLDDVTKRANDLEEFQERILGNDFFRAAEQLRWNNYLYIVAGPKSVNQEGFAAAKVLIEANKEYARKCVVSLDELEVIFAESKLFDAKNLPNSMDVVAEWATSLAKAGLDSLIDKPTPRTSVIERIGAKTAARISTPTKQKELTTVDAQLNISHLRLLDITNFRPIHDGRVIPFGSVNLIVGPNGSGKTSLLEAIEYLYCGFNRRAAASIGNIVKGTFCNLQTSKTFTAQSTSDTSRIKARCSAWYRRNEHHANRIIEGFTRYNFLDTDAAYRLSTELKPEDISKDLSKLLIGEEASILWEYLEKITSDLDSAWALADERLRGERERAKLYDTEFKRLQNMPSQGKSLTATFREALEKLNWIGDTSNAPLVSVNERQALDTAVGHLNVLIATDAAGAATKRGVEARAAAIEIAIEKALPLKSQLDSLESKSKAALTSVDDLQSAVTLLNEWISYCNATFGAVLTSKKIAQESFDQARAIIGKFVNSPIPVIKAEQAIIPLDDAEAAARELTQSLTTSVAALESTANGFGVLEATRAQIAQQLKDAALQILKHQNNGRECPVCGTDHEPATLIEKIGQITAKGGSSTELRDINLSLESTRNSLTVSQRWLHDLAAIRQIALQLKLSGSTPIGEIMSRFDKAREDSLDWAAKLDSAQELLNSIELIGLNEQRYVELRARVSKKFDDVSDIDAATTLTALRDMRDSQREAAEVELNSIRKKMEETSDQIASIVDQLDSQDWPKVPAQKRNLNGLIELQNSARQLSSHVLGINRFMNVDDNVSFINIRHLVLGVTKALDEALHAITSEENASMALNNAKHALDGSMQKIKTLEEVASNQKAALDALKGLVKEHSLQTATQDALSVISTQIDDVFGRIHSPREYEYNSGGHSLLRTRSHHEPRTLDQVSTGQRAAFALSIFLAMSLTAQFAPPLLLIDDPIAHIDDLNGLSFMDYLRDLAVHSKRQIFFATADSRIATLFQKKFAFLGAEEFKTIQLSRRVEA
ncbi:MAG: AAA family ATPase [Burkholderiaceae bacterium]